MLDLPTALTAAPETPGAACRVRGLTVRRGARETLRGVDFTLAPGEKVALVGPNGAGKTTLLNAVVGLLAAADGGVETLGADMRAAKGRRAVRARTGFVFQQHGLVRRRSALSNVLHGLMARRGAWGAWSAATAPAAWRAEAMEALAEVGLADRAADRADRLSGGQAQRVAVARALVCRPALVIADEPTASLDPAAGREVMELFCTLVDRRGAALLFTTHDMEHARAYADRVVGLRGGRIALDLPAAKASPRALGELFDG
ncbi:phosphonate ABC transporter ATP-binding protein [Rhodovulum sp. DZ06]|uniref:phosphonate ABC transporter ATP-binding protein n=1 Tax=Rhodovulum sp. DZ06 TaxID=3425126 RepID=UPI003D341425